MAAEVFKIHVLHKISLSYLQDLISEKVSNYNIRNKKQVQVPQVNSERYGKKSFRFEATQVWNSLRKWIKNGWKLPAVQEAAADLGWYELYFLFLLNFVFS